MDFQEDVGRFLMFASSNYKFEELAKSDFRKLFALYGKDETGAWVKNLIPDSILQSKDFEKLKENSPKVKFVTRNGKTYLENFESLNGEDLKNTLFLLLQGRGRNGTNLALRKIPEAWVDKTSRFDKMISDQLAEEWRDENRFAGFEFSMQGHVEKGKDLREYVKHIWLRVGLAKEGDARLEEMLDKMRGHVHWVPDIQAVTDPIARELLYRALVGYWGDANDSNVVRQNSVYELLAEPGGQVNLNAYLAQEAWMQDWQKLNQYSITLLTRETFDRVSSNSNGILIRDREKDLEPDVDPNIPPVFKRLSMGLRGAYGQATLPPGRPIPMTGLEGRGTNTQEENLSSLPQKIPGTPEVDLDRFLPHSVDGKRGVLSSIATLREKAIAMKIDPDLVDSLDSSIQPPINYPRDNARAYFFLPLNDWLAHPLVVRSLASMKKGVREHAVQKYQAALGRYVRRVNDLARARKEPRYHYQPEWTDSLEEFPDGINRVYPRADFPEIAAPGRMNSRPDLWFQIILVNEQKRFTTESGLTDLMAVH